MQISKKTGYTQEEISDLLQKTLDLITESLANGKSVELRNFGVFDVRLTSPRVGRNPHFPDKELVIPARAAVRFRAGKAMRQRVLLRTEDLRRAAQ